MRELISIWKHKPIVIFLIALAGLSPFFIPFAIVNFGMIGGVLIILTLSAPFIIFGVVKYPKFGIMLFLVMAYLLMFILSFGIDFPLGTMMDGILVLLFIGYLINQKNQPNTEIFKNSISIIIVIWIVYNLLEVVNPSASSRLAWVYTIRSLAGVMLSYFVFMYQIKSVTFIRLIIKVWLALSVFAALYALKQEFFGFSSFEEANLKSNPVIAGLLFIDGHWRKFSIFADPVSFSYNMNVSSILCIGLMFGPFSKSKKVILGGMVLLFLYSMLFSGTRAAYVLLPVAMFLLLILNLNIKMIVFSGIFAFVFLVLVFMPTTNYTIYRFQSAFKPSNDASYNLRTTNQKRIRPYIYTHPIGGGLGSAGASGSRFSPNSFLAQFPPDSGYVRAAVEQGWIGLILLCSMFFIVLRNGINNYFKIKDPELKTYCLAMTLIVFALVVGNYPQEALIQFPLNVYFCLFMALINITLVLDKRKQEMPTITD